jgi:hypothetical protein
VVSIPRDTQAEIVGRGTTEKINHAYAYGGPTMAVKSLEKLMNVPIDYLFLRFLLEYHVEYLQAQSFFSLDSLIKSLLYH